MHRPNFLILGAQRAGSTWLYRNLKSHPECFMPEQKELEFFSQLPALAELGFEGYCRKHFAAAGGARAIGEATPSYFWTEAGPREWLARSARFNPRTPETVLELLGPHTRLVVSLRNPVERAVSNYVRLARKRQLPAAEGLLANGKFNGIVHMGFYHAHLSRWLEAFPREQLEVLVFEELVAQPERGLAELAAFLDIDPRHEFELLHEPQNQVPWTMGDEGVFMLKRGHRSTDRGSLAAAELELVVPRTELDELASLYRDDVRRLSGLLDRDLSTWGIA